MTYENGRIEVLPKGFDARFSATRQPRKAFQARVDGAWLSHHTGYILEFKTEDAALQAAKKRIGA